MFGLCPSAASCSSLETVSTDANTVRTNKWALYTIMVPSGGLLSGITMFIDGISVSVTRSSSATFADRQVSRHWVGKSFSAFDTAGLDLAALWVYDRKLTDGDRDLIHATAPCFPGAF